MEMLCSFKNGDHRPPYITSGLAKHELCIHMCTCAHNYTAFKVKVCIGNIIQCSYV